MTSFDHTITERFVLQRDELPDADFADVRRRAERLSSGDAVRGVAERRIRRSWRLPTRLVIVVAVIIIAGGSATAFAVHSLSQSPVTQGFSALTDPTLPEVTPSTPGFSSLLASEFVTVFGPDYTVRQVGDGMFLGQHDGALCAIVEHGFGGCTDNLDQDTWPMGDMIRAYDAETAPFSVHFYGFARDSVAAIRVTTSNGNTTSVPVEHNAFQTTLTHTSFADIAAIEVVSTSGQTSAIDPRRYFGDRFPKLGYFPPATLPNINTTTTSP